MINKEKLALKVANDYLGCELSQLNHVERNIINLTIDATEQEMLLEFGHRTQLDYKALLKLQAKKIFKTIREKCIHNDLGFLYSDFCEEEDKWLK